MKDQVYSWRISAQKKAELESEARREGVSLAQLLDQITTDWQDGRRNSRDSEESEQTAIRKRAAAAIGSIAGGDPERSSRSSQRVKQILRRRYGR